jgi:arginine exporter protein ArgO
VSNTSSTGRAPATHNDLLRTAARVVGAVFLLVGVLGFVPGITSNYGDMSVAGHESMAMLLGIFQVSILHNIVHLLFGVAGIVMSRTDAGSRTFLIGGGAVYLVLWLYGLVIDQSSAANFVPVNTADNWLHFFLGVGMIALGVLLSRRRSGVRA